MAFDFPAAPTDGQVFTPPGGSSYVYNLAATAWYLDSVSTTVPPHEHDHIEIASFDMWAGFKLTPQSNNAFAINDKVDGTGNDVLLMHDQGGLTVFGNHTAAGHAAIKMVKGTAASATAKLIGERDGLKRWDLFLGDGVAESTGNIGSDFRITSYQDDGSTLSTPMLIARATSKVTCPGDIRGAKLIAGASLVTSENENIVLAPGVGSASSLLYLRTDVSNLATQTSLAPDGELRVGGRVFSEQDFCGSNQNIAICTNGAGTVYLRPNGVGVGTAQTSINNFGNMTVDGNVQTLSGYFANPQAGAATYLSSEGGGIRLRPNGTVSVVGEFIVNSSGNAQSAGNMAIGSGYLVSLMPNLYLNAAGPSGIVYTRPSGSGSTAGQSTLNGSGNFSIAGPNGSKSTAGSWIANSDARIKTVTGEYTAGLAELLQITPKRFTFKGNESLEDPALDPENADAPLREGLAAPYEASQHYSTALSGEEFIGLVAQEAEVSMPEMVTQVAAFIDGAAVSDLRQIDITPLTYALINAVKELSARLEALEGGAPMAASATSTNKKKK